MITVRFGWRRACIGNRRFIAGAIRTWLGLVEAGRLSVVSACIEARTGIGRLRQRASGREAGAVAAIPRDRGVRVSRVDVGWILGVVGAVDGNGYDLCGAVYRGHLEAVGQRVAVIER